MIDKYKGHKGCYCCEACSFSCPNAAAEAYCNKYDIDYSDIGYKEIKCNECAYNDYECDSCYLQYSEDCHEQKMEAKYNEDDY